MSEPEVVLFHEADIERHEKMALIDGETYNLPGDRRVEVWRMKDHEGLAIRIFRPTRDGKVSKLAFSLSVEAAYALCTLLKAKLEKDDWLDV